ncbi:MAG: hypothetical protein M3N32_09220 [Actinomycetota bacterium]|nr:hypothetical protein [Actinomycetota bacterium]
MIEATYPRRILALVAIGALALGAGACGIGEKAEKKERATVTEKVKVKDVPTIVEVTVGTEMPK